MPVEIHRQFGSIISHLVQGRNLSRDSAAQAFSTVLRDATTPMQQGAFLAALAAKGETEEEIAGAWEAIYNLDTIKSDPLPDRVLVENCGTGMDAFKTFNISTAAAVIAAAGGVAMARHGARSITSTCGTVDMAEALGVDVDCPVEVVTESIDRAGIGLFNGMSSAVHPRALFRILPQIHFGSILNTAASLASPLMPAVGLRGVYCREMMVPVLRVMKAIGYERAMVFHGTVSAADPARNGMDEASVCGPTYCVGFNESGEIEPFVIRPEDYGLDGGKPEELAPASDIEIEVRRFVNLIRNREDGPRKDAVLLNAALIFHTTGKASGMAEGLEMAAELLESGQAFAVLEAWVAAQNRRPKEGLRKLERYVEPALAGRGLS